jgi:hypothetical protein
MYELPGRVAEVAELLLGMEHEHRGAGWDDTLYPVCRDSPETEGVAAFAVQPMPLSWLPTVTVSDALILVARMLSIPGHQPTLARCYSSAPVAHMLLCEAAAVAVLGTHRLRIRHVRGREPELLHTRSSADASVLGAVTEALVAVDRAARRAYLAAKPETN